MKLSPIIAAIKAYLAAYSLSEKRYLAEDGFHPQLELDYKSIAKHKFGVSNPQVPTCPEQVPTALLEDEVFAETYHLALLEEEESLDLEVDPKELTEANKPQANSPVQSDTTTSTRENTGGTPSTSTDPLVGTQATQATEATQTSSEGNTEQTSDVTSKEPSAEGQPLPEPVGFLQGSETATEDK